MRLRLYVDKAHELDLGEIAGYVEEKTVFPVEIAGEFLERWSPSPGLAEKLARIRIKDFAEQGGLGQEPSKEAIALEEAALRGGEPLPFDPEHVYEGFELEGIFRELIGDGDLHVVFTSRMFATWGGDRYHGRTIICSYPLALISTTGFVEAPARPKEYYAKLLAHQKAEEMGFKVSGEFEEELKREFGERMLSYDHRLTEVAKGYVLQAAAFFLTHDAFCSDPACRLYNAHTQEEMIDAQLKSGGVCGLHRKILKKR